MMAPNLKIQLVNGWLCLLWHFFKNAQVISYIIKGPKLSP